LIIVVIVDVMSGVDSPPVQRPLSPSPAARPLLFVRCSAPSPHPWPPLNHSTQSTRMGGSQHRANLKGHPFWVPRHRVLKHARATSYSRPALSSSMINGNMMRQKMGICFCRTESRYAL
jgi:hypothetical protein